MIRYGCVTEGWVHLLARCPDGAVHVAAAQRRGPHRGRSIPQEFDGIMKQGQRWRATYWSGEQKLAEELRQRVRADTFTADCWRRTGRIFHRRVEPTLTLLPCFADERIASVSVFTKQRFAPGVSPATSGNLARICARARGCDKRRLSDRHRQQRRTAEHVWLRTGFI
jgi:hypothetical protein